MTVTDVLTALLGIVVIPAILVWLVLLVKARFFDKDVVIAPFLVTGHDDSDGRMARSLAVMLQNRLRQLQRQFEASQAALLDEQTSANSAAPANYAEAQPINAVVRLNAVSNPIEISAHVVDSPSINVTVAGIEFGGVTAWLSRVAARRRTLTVAIHFSGDTALVTTTLDRLPNTVQRELWLETSAEPQHAVTALAYAILQWRIAHADVTTVAALEPEEFQTLLTSLSEIADLNRRITFGRASDDDDYRRLSAELSPLLAKVPRWRELHYILAQLADRTAAYEQALDLYTKLLRLPGVTTELHESVTSRVRELERLRAPARSTGPGSSDPPEVRESAFVAAARDYERRLGLTPPFPEICFMSEQPKHAGTLAIWNDESKRYEVNPESADEAAARSAALMGRFLARHSGKCDPVPDVWNEFRFSVVEYLITTDEPTLTLTSWRQLPLLGALRRMAAHTGEEPVRRLCITALDGFDCTWNASNLAGRLAAVGAGIGIAPETVRQAFLPPADQGSDQIAS